MDSRAQGGLDRDLLLFGALAIAGYWLFSKFTSGIGDAASRLSAPIANAYVGWTSGAAPVPQGSAVFPDGSYVPMANLSPNWVGNSLQFSYGGHTWALSAHDASGNYPASLVA